MTSLDTCCYTRIKAHNGLLTRRNVRTISWLNLMSLYAHNVP